MRTRRLLAAAAVAACTCGLVAGGALGAGVQKNYRLVRAGDDKAKQQPPAPFTTGPNTCTPDLTPDVLASLPPAQRTAPEVLGAGFDPGLFDEISVAGDGKLLALATSISDAGIPGAGRQIVILPEGGPAVASIRIPVVASDDDEPSIQLDEFGYRCVFRSSAGPGGTAPSNIQIYSLTKAGATPTTATVAITTGTSDSSFDPTFTARIRVREVKGGVKVRERDARVAFISTEDADPGRNPSHLEQLFVWQEKDNVFRQITRNTDVDAHMNRPCMSKSGSIIFFEATADLVKDSVDPLDASRVGNPNHVRQIFRWRSARGIDQITWSGGDCFSPRMEPNGRFVLFSSRGDPITGGNPEKNLEVFAWLATGRPINRLRQMTQTTQGDSVFPRPSLRADVFTFYSTAHPPVRPDPSKPAGPGNLTPAFGEGNRECTPQALLFDRGRVVHIHGFLDFENAVRLGAVPQQVPVLTGPPVLGIFPLKIYFATNDFHLNPKPAAGDPPDDTASPIAFFVAMATRFSR